MAPKNSDTPFKYVQTHITYYQSVPDVHIQKFALILLKIFQIILLDKNFYSIFSTQWQTISPLLSIKNKTPNVGVKNTIIKFPFINSPFHNLIESLPFN